METLKREILLEHLKTHLSEVQFKSLRQNEIELDDQEKLRQMQEILEKDPALFLTKWGRFLPKEQLQNFYSLRGDYEVNWLLDHLQRDKNNNSPETISRNLSPSQRKDKKIINRRFKYLLNNLENTSYFSDEAMEMREPLLYEEYIGKYIPEEERYPPFSDEVDLVERIYYDIDQNNIRERLQYQKMIQEEQMQEEEDDEDEENEKEYKSAENEAKTVANLAKLHITDDEKEKTIISDDEIIKQQAKEVDTNEEMNNNQRHSNSNIDKNIENLSTEELNELREELIDIMRGKFISGNDTEFDYDQIDYNEEFDNTDQETNDIQDNYFDKEEPNDTTENNHDTGILDY
ncbi:3179_t:CDS:2 [Ambispora gerdemannii]|uniref:3179_t:CDS:1 n=1 Tax=Ambispora gerdemannii TaxID=144530 RepID=A0A9N9BV16_9GLOM|nr:3179_t:CDS:2 [Ambispora gerdemannii]